MEVASGTASGNSKLRKPSVIAWLRLAKVCHKVDRASAGQLSTYGLSVGQFDVLAHVGAHEGITQKELAEKLLVTKSNVCQILGRMEERGLVTRRQDCVPLPSGRGTQSLRRGRALPGGADRLPTLLCNVRRSRPTLENPRQARPDPAVTPLFCSDGLLINYQGRYPNVSRRGVTKRSTSGDKYK